MSTIVPANIKRQVGLLMRKKKHSLVFFFVSIFWNHISKEVNDNSYTFFSLSLHLLKIGNFSILSRAD